MSFLCKSVKVLYAILMTIVLLVLFFFSKTPYITEQFLLCSNIFSLILIVLFFFIFCIGKFRDISNKVYYKYLIFIFFILFTVQLLIVTYGYFTPTWDAGHLKRTVNTFMRYGFINDMEYMTRYPNNTMLTFILILIRSIPFVGKSNFILLLVNCLLVNFAGLFTSLSVRNITKNRKCATLVYFITAPLIILSPWIMVVYSDTFAILFPILIFYIYSKEKRDYRDYFFIFFLGIFGYYIKPTIIIILIAVIMVSIVFNLKKIFNIRKWNYHGIIKYTFVSFLGLFVALLLNQAGRVYLNYKKADNVVEFNMLHFMAMGLNEETEGIYNGKDVLDTINYGNGQNIDKIKKRLTERDLGRHFNFYLKKTLVNFNDGSFAWGKEGAFFLNQRSSKNQVTRFINRIYSEKSSYFTVVQFIWLLVLFFLPFCALQKVYEKNNFVLMLSIIGIFLFLTLFEARARYLYCFSPIFVVAFVNGILQVKIRIFKYLKFDI